MSAQANETLIRSLYTAFNARKFDDAVKLASPKAELTDVPTGETLRGHDGVRQNLERWANTFNDAKVDIKRIIATDKFVVAEFVGRGTHTGPLETPTGSISPTNRKVDMPFCEIHTIEGGKIVNSSTYYDLATMLNQIGVTELAAAGSHR